MSIQQFSLKTLESHVFAPSANIPPYAAFIPESRVEEAQVAGPDAPAVGALIAMRVHQGGFVYTELPGPESGFIVDGQASVRDADGEYTLDAGQGYYFPAGWSGSFEAVTPVTKVFYIL